MPQPKENLPQRSPARSTDWYPGSLWWDAETILVTREAAPNRWETLTRLVVPIGQGRAAFRLSSWSPEAQRMRTDRRVIVQAGDRLGRPALGSRQHQGLVELVSGGPLFDTVQEGMRVKYGMRLSLARLGHRLILGSAPYADLIAVVTVHENKGWLALP
ncbi:hypothetical protein [Nocardia paucivorans]|uniref:hypothetical protein n=1 Tax=Nocardia paucivorans TaxID=114259 RepID=UPI0012F90CFD|nr:hypothetical protein [Nocardia paucivorans]